MAQQVVRPKTNLGPGFWPITALIAVVSAVMVVLVYISPWPIGLIPAGAPADTIDSLFKFLGAVAAVLFNIVTIYTIYFAIVFRKPPGAPASTIGVQIHDAPILEFWWTAIPTILVVILAIFSTKVWYDLQTTPGGALTVEAIGYQFGFQFRYPHLADPVSGELHLPADTPVTIRVTSRDVIHGFWIPELRMKADMVPGLINTIRVTPTIPGTYRIVCTEFCGVAHGAMHSSVVVQSKADFDKWFSQQGGSAQVGGSNATQLAAGDAAKGGALFQQKCTTCHSTGTFTQKVVGPGLGKVLNDPDHPKLVDGDPATPANVAKIVTNGYTGDMGTMPNASMNGLSGPDIANLVAYLASLSKK